MSRHIVLINGPNINLLGFRESKIDSDKILEDIEYRAEMQAKELGFTLETFQSNHEGALVDKIQDAAGWGPAPNVRYTDDDKASAIIINPGAYTHTSIAIRDALFATGIPFVVVHMSNVHAHESFRDHSYLSDKAVAVIAGLGAFGYQAALEFVATHLERLVEDEAFIPL